MSGGRRRAPGRALAARVATIAALLTVLGPSVAAGAIAPAPPSTSLPTLAPIPAARCGGSTTPGSFTGSLAVEGGGSSPPSVSGVSLQFTYWVELNFTPANGTSSFSCISQSVAATTDSLGGFSVSAPVPTGGCNRFSCSLYSGPFGPLGFSMPYGLPPGFFLTQSVSGTTVALAYVDALTSTRLAPASRVTLSADAPTIVHAYPTAGNGGPSPALVGFAWRLEGSGWTLVNGSSSANATIEAADGAAPGTLTVWVNGSYNGTAVAAPAATLDLSAFSTALDSASAAPTQLDVGYPTTFTVTGEGAGGYTYTAVVTPGLGAADTTAPCTTSVVAGGLLSLTCSASVTYATAGTAAPTARLTNGFSSASRPFPTILVSAALGLTLSPADLVAYAGQSAAVSVTAAAGTGTAPVGPACLWPGDGRSYCVTGAGPSYPFSVAYGTPGEYTGKATITDSSGANGSAPFSATIYDRPALSSFVASTNTLSVGENATIVGSVSGGALPIAYWWNATAPVGTLYEGTLTADGPLAFTFVPHVAGPTEIVLTVRDALGTVESYPTAMNVTAGPASYLVGEVALGGVGIAGTPIAINYTAVDPAGEPVPGWAGDVALTIASAAPGGPLPSAWVNTSGSPVALSNSAYAVPVTDWSRGTLSVTIDLAGAGDFLVTLSGGLPRLGGGPVESTLRVAPDPGHLRLFHPQVALAGLRTNRTLYGISDRFGDALVGGSIQIDEFVSGSWNNSTSTVLGNVSTGTSVWVNYSVPEGVAATVFVEGPDAVYLLPPIAILAPTSGAVVPTGWLLLAVGIALAAGSAVGLLRRWRRPSLGAGDDRGEAPASEDELRRWAEGRAHVLGRASSERGQTLDELAQGFVGKPPRPEELTDWVASLVAEGSLRTVLGDDGRSRFVRVGGDDRAPLRVHLDDRALAEALDRRAALEADDRAASDEGPARRE